MYGHGPGAKRPSPAAAPHLKERVQHGRQVRRQRICRALADGRQGGGRRLLAAPLPRRQPGGDALHAARMGGEGREEDASAAAPHS